MEKKSIKEIVDEELIEITRRVGHNSPFTLRELNGATADIIIEDAIKSAVSVTELKCPVCKEGWDLEWDAFVKFYYCKECAGIFKLEIGE
jgi:hypothetical protein